MKRIVIRLLFTVGEWCIDKAEAMCLKEARNDRKTHSGPESKAE